MGWALIWSDRCPYNKRKCGPMRNTRNTRQRGASWGHNKEADTWKPKTELRRIETCWILWSWTSSLQTCEKMDSCLSHQSVVLFHSSPSTGAHHPRSAPQAGTLGIQSAPVSDIASHTQWGFSRGAPYKGTLFEKHTEGLRDAERVRYFGHPSMHVLLSGYTQKI